MSAASRILIALVPLPMAACSYVRTDGTSSTAWTLGGRGSVQAPGVATTYNNDESLSALVDAARKSITAKVVADAANRVVDEVGDVRMDDNATAVAQDTIRARERVSVRQLSEETRRLRITSE